MCGNIIEAKDRRRKYCADCAEARKHFFDRNAVQAFRERARKQRLAEQEELEGLRTENEMLREELIQLKARMRRSGQMAD
jgi:hypothetical protein